MCVYTNLKSPNFSNTFEEGVISFDILGFRDLHDNITHLIDIMKSFKLQKELTSHFMELQQLYIQATETVLNVKKETLLNLLL